MAKMWLEENSAAATVLNYLASKVNWQNPPGCRQGGWHETITLTRRSGRATKAGYQTFPIAKHGCVKMIEAVTVDAYLAT
jgi:hypothetical protein